MVKVYKLNETATGGKQGLELVVLVDRQASRLDQGALYSRLREEIERSRRYQHFVSLLVIAVEGLEWSKNGDGVAVEDIAKLLVDSTRSVDIVAHYEEGQFALILPETAEDGAICLAVRLKDHIECYLFDEAEGRLTPRVRYGVASFPADARLEPDLIRLAQERAKEERL